MSMRTMNMSFLWICKTQLAPKPTRPLAFPRVREIAYSPNLTGLNYLEYGIKY